MVETVALAAFAALFPISIALALRYAGPVVLRRSVSWLRAIAVTLAVVLSAAGGVAAIVAISRAAGWPGYAISIALLVVLLACAFVGPTLILRLSQREGAKILVTIAFAAAVVAGLGLMFLTPLLVKAYKLPTNAMAPTLLGPHFVGKCPACGGETIASVHNRGGANFDEPAPAEHSICSQCWRAAPPEQVDDSIRGGDRILVRRWAAPARWDVVVFPFPKNPRVIYDKRLVGLPGETIQIIDGEIWIDGEKLSPPNELEHARWDLPADQMIGPEFACDEPYTLGDNECFVLGDNSQNSYDSRFWGPAPWNDLRGVVWLVYFPPRAWRTIEKH